MRLFFSVCLLILLTPLAGLAQDKIVNTKGDTLQVKLLEVNPENVKYKQFNYLDGPVFTLLKEEIRYIIYQNGTSESFAEYKPKKNQSADNTIQMSGRFFYFRDRKISEPDMLAIVSKLNDKRLNGMVSNVDRLRFGQNFSMGVGIASFVVGFYMYRSNQGGGGRRGGRRGAPVQSAANVQMQTTGKFLMLGGLMAEAVSLSFKIDKKKHVRVLVDTYNTAVSAP